MSAYTRPFVIGAPGTSGTSKLLERIPLDAAAGGVQSERWLQEALYRHPESLPVKEIDPHIGPLMPVCMEIETGAGPADILYLTPSGQVVLVETKLWRNPEARREVVGQILDYAKQLTSWSFDVLEKKAATAARAQGPYLLSCLRSRFPEADEVAFVDGVRRSLSTGDFLLIIAGDGIRYGAESLVAFLERFGHLRFGLALVEVAAYKLPDGSTLLQPRVLAKTELLQRTLLMGPSGPVTLQQAAQAEDTADPNPSSRAWFQAFWTEYLAKLRLDDAALLPAEPAKSTNQFIPMPPGGASAWVSAYVAQSSGKGGVYLTFAKAFEPGLEWYEQLQADAEAIEREVGVKLLWERVGDKIYLGVPTVALGNLNVPADRERVTAYLADMTRRLVSALEPRLAAMAAANT